MGKKWLVALEKAGSVLASLISGFITKDPYFGLIMQAAIASLGLKLEADRALQANLEEFLKFIDQHPDDFFKGVSKDPEFKEGFLFIFDACMKVRGEKRRDAMQRILLGFTRSDDKEKFELEKLLFYIQSLSFDELQILALYADCSLEKWLEQKYPDDSADQLKLRFENEKRMPQDLYKILLEMHGKKLFTLGYIFELLESLSGMGLMSNMQGGGGLTHTPGRDNMEFRPTALCLKLIQIIKEE